MSGVDRLLSYIPEDQKCLYAFKNIIGSKGDIYQIVALKQNIKFNKPSVVQCTCKGYMYRRTCKHSKEYNEESNIWNNIKWNEM